MWCGVGVIKLFKLVWMFVLILKLFLFFNRISGKLYVDWLVVWYVVFIFGYVCYVVWCW